MRIRASSVGSKLVEKKNYRFSCFITRLAVFTPHQQTYRLLLRHEYSWKLQKSHRDTVIIIFSHIGRQHRHVASSPWGKSKVYLS